MTAPTFAPFGVEDLRHRARRLLRDAPLGAPFVGHDDPRFAELVRVSELRPASVLVGIVDRRPAASVLLIRRADHLAKHSGQIAFPGGKIDASDAGPREAALREAREEIGLDPARVEPLGWLDPHATGTGFLIYPMVAIVRPPFELAPDPSEVAEAFEAPLAFLMDPARHERESRELRGGIHAYWVMRPDGRKIWGATAAIVRNLHDRLYAP